MAVSLVHIQKVPLHIRLPKTVYSGTDNSLVLLFPGFALGNVLIQHLELLLTIPPHFPSGHCKISILAIFAHNADFIIGRCLFSSFSFLYSFTVLIVALRRVTLSPGHGFHFLKATIAEDSQQSAIGVKSLSIFINNTYTSR